MRGRRGIRRDLVFRVGIWWTCRMVFVGEYGNNRLVYDTWVVY